MARTLQDPTFEASVNRNVHIYDNDGRVVGGIYQHGTLTHHHLYDLCPHFLEFTPPNAPWRIFAVNNDGSTGDQLPNDGTHAVPGRYLVLRPNRTPMSISLNPDSFPRRVLSRTGTGQLTNRREHFRTAIRSRDKHCMITGDVNPGAAIDDYLGLKAAHIFPHAREMDWSGNHFERFITDNASTALIGITRIHSPQNGLLLSATAHLQFDAFPRSGNLDNRTLELECRDPQNPLRVSDDLLRWHFHMAVLANMSGAAGEPAWEMDFPDGDMMGEIMEGPHAAERMETELFHRLGPG